MLAISVQAWVAPCSALDDIGLIDADFPSPPLLC